MHASVVRFLCPHNLLLVSGINLPFLTMSITTHMAIGLMYIMEHVILQHNEIYPTYLQVCKATSHGTIPYLLELLELEAVLLASNPLASKFLT